MTPPPMAAPTSDDRDGVVCTGTVVVGGTDLVTLTGLDPTLTGTSGRPHATHYWSRRRLGWDWLHRPVYGGLNFCQPLLDELYRVGHHA